MSATAIGSERRLGPRVWRWTLLAHRYAGIALGVLVFAWCFSGVVLMYIPYPSLTPLERLAGLAPLDAGECCRIPAGTEALPVADHALEMLNGRLVLRLQSRGDTPVVLEIASGVWMDAPDAEAAAVAGAAFGRRLGIEEPRLVERLARDQWTVHSRFSAHRPLYRFSGADGREWYVSSRTLEVVQLTEPVERLWNWLGAVVHWLYPTALRQHPYLWSQVVIVLTLAGLFLTVTGIVVGIHMLGGRRRGRLSPYRGWTLWHHWSGLVFGVLTLTWLVSGLASMNPWGWLESRDFSREAGLLNGHGQTLAEVAERLERVLEHVPPETVRLESAPWLGTPAYVARSAAGSMQRLTAAGPAAPVDLTAAREAAERMHPAAEIHDVALLEGPDAYYYPHHHQPREFPVIRILTGDGDQPGERYYVSPRSGRLLQAVDASARASRWIFAALHRGDFHAVVRARPWWDLMMLLALAGVTVGAGTGAYLGLRRLFR